MSELPGDVQTAGAAGSPIGGPELPSAEGVARVTEAATDGRLVLRAGQGNADTLDRVLGNALKGRVNTATLGDGCTALRLGPDEWLLLAEPDSDPWLAARIAEAGKAFALSVVDVSHRHAGLLLSGPAPESVLAVGCPLPLDTTSFPVGRATRTVFGKAEVVLWRREADRFQLEVARSFAPYVVSLLAVAIEDLAAIAALSQKPR